MGWRIFSLQNEEIEYGLKMLLDQHNPTPTQKPKKSMLLSKQPLNRTEIYNRVETSVNSDGEHSKSLADEEGDYAEASELYSRSLEISEESEGKLKGILGYTEDDVVSTDFDGDGRWCMWKEI
ncbi:uncharacterized protein LOC131299746 [Rhododendron vialii]|uniref:uncharacterized protein LOC131299746 n=1 Tax=Rhododendron vialii TaxID=182163 RepID=UPI00265EEA78|nr:uncharacterized protein LOC131299746 [Rhododendron vialii]